MNDFLNEADLLALGLCDRVVARLLHDSQLTGSGGQPVVEADRLPDLLAMLDLEGRAAVALDRLTAALERTDP